VGCVNLKVGAGSWERHCARLHDLTGQMMLLATIRMKKDMEEEKRKKLEAKLIQLFAQYDEPQESKRPVRADASGVRLIRRRKGNPDKHIA
jgi:hypothetical protein